MSLAPAYFQTRLVEDPRREQLWRHLAKYLARFVPADADILELGAGFCYFINRIPGKRRVAVDQFSELPRYAGEGVEARVQDALEFVRQCRDHSFDFVFASNFFEHFDWAVLDEMLPHIVRTLRPRGRLGVLQPNFRTAPRRYFDDYTHRVIFTDVSLHDWLTANGLVVTHLDPRFLPLTIKSRASSFPFLVPWYLRSPFRPFAGQMLAIAERRSLDEAAPVANRRR